MKTIHNIDVKFVNNKKSKRILSLHTHADHRVFDAHDARDSMDFSAYIKVSDLVKALAEKKDINEILKQADSE